MNSKRKAITVLLASACAAASVPLISQANPTPSARSSATRLLVGVGDNSPAMFGNQWFQRIPIKIARDGVDWNAAITRNHAQLNAARAWIQAALAVGVEPMIAFGAPQGKAGNFVPSANQYGRAVKAFIRRFPQVKVYAAWNEPDFIYRSLSRKPQLAAAYYNRLAGLCHGCTIVAGDLYLASNAGLGKWIRAYKRGLRSRPRAWGLHPYDDVRSHTTSQIRTLERYVGPGAQIWLDEISGVERRGHWRFRNQSARAANRDERFLFKLPTRFHNITRIYHYEWQGSPHDPWDSGLLGGNGKPRPAYWTFANAAQGKLP